MRITHPTPGTDAYTVYRAHKSRFPDSGSEDTYAGFCQSLFSPFSFSYALEMHLGSQLVAVAHFDMTPEALSAVYCYYSLDHLHRSPGRYAILRQLAFALENSIPHVYLGYYIAENRHMRYKCQYRPNNSSPVASAGDIVPRK